MGREDLLLDANQEQKEKYLFPYLQGEKEVFIALTEPNAGSDTFAIETRAVKNGRDYVLNGTKTFITMAERSDFGLVFAVTDPAQTEKKRMTCFLVDKGTPGFLVSRDIPMFGRRGLDTCELAFMDCVVPEENVLGEIGDGFKVFRRYSVFWRLGLAGYCAGAAQRVYDLSLQYAKQRITFGQPLARRQAIQHILADIATDLYATRMMNYNAAWEYDEGMDIRTRAMQVKVFASEMACRAADGAMQIHGGYGYTKEFRIEMVYRDLRLFRIAEGATEIPQRFCDAFIGIERPFFYVCIA